VQVYEQLAKRVTSLECVVVSQRLGADPDEIERFDSAWLPENGSQIRRLNRLELNFGAGTSLWNRVLDCGQFFWNARAEWRRLVRELRPDLIVCGATLEAGWLMDYIPSRTPFITYLHGEELATQNGSRFVWRYQFKKQIQSIRHSALNIAVSRYTATKAAKLAGIESARFQVLPNFVDLTRFFPPDDREALRRSLGWNNKKIILSLSRLTPRKGIDKAILALAELRRADRLSPEWLHVIAGRGEQEKQLRALVAEVGAAPYTQFAGFVEDEQVPMYYGAADIFLQPNRDLGGDTEGFGIVFLEASACGTPSIGGVAGGTADAIRDGVTGFRVDAEDASAIREAVLALTQSRELRHTMGLAGIEIVRREHQVDKMVEQFEGLVREVLRK
jgi:phosphatidylinositol alpha-1,6-mannosyltransferase